MNRIISILMSIGAVVFGIIFVISGIKTVSERDLYDTQITAKVVDVQEEWESSADPDEPDRLVNTAYIDYEVNGTKYEHVLAPEQDEDLKIGDTVDILVQSQAPENISGLNPSVGGVIFIVLGALVAVGGCVATLRIFVRRR